MYGIGTKAKGMAFGTWSKDMTSRFQTKAYGITSAPQCNGKTFGSFSEGMSCEP